MPVTVSLFHFVQVPNSRPLWPAEFRAMVEACEKDVTDRLPFGVVADWCDENGEAELGEAFRWLHKRPAVQVVLTGRELATRWGRLQGQPLAVGTVDGKVGTELIGVVVALATRLAEMREAMA